VYVRVVEVPQEVRRLRAQSLLELEEEGPISRLSLIRRPPVDIHDRVPSLTSFSDSYPWAFNLLMTILQGQLFTLLIS